LYVLFRRTALFEGLLELAPDKYYIQEIIKGIVGLGISVCFVFLIEICLFAGILIPLLSDPVNKQHHLVYCSEGVVGA
jgi:hypothetical protein